MRRLSGLPNGVEAHTASGIVRARAAVLAVGSAATAPHGPLRNRLTVASSHIVLTEPVPELLEEVGWTGGECITDSRALIDYFRTTPDGRIAFGWGGGRIAMGARLHGRTELDPEVASLAAANLWDYFPGLQGRALTHAWGGPIDASPTHLPLVLPLHGGRTFAAAGYTGNGVGPSHMVGRTLASLALDRRDEPSRLAFVDPSPPRVPPEPFNWIGGEAIRGRNHPQGESRAIEPQPGPPQLSPLPRPGPNRLPHRPVGEPRGRLESWADTAKSSRYISATALSGRGTPGPLYRCAGTTSTGRSAICSSLFGVDPRIIPFNGGSP